MQLSKLKVIKYAEANNNCAAAHKFVVNEKQVQEWRKSKAALEKMPKSMKARHTRIAFFPELEKELCDFVRTLTKWIHCHMSCNSSTCYADAFHSCIGLFS
ncbi:hypothetical protein ACJMK2_032404 [Sinanodonta woodiana]|uniref:Brinker DNA-binding domain-containing protein n=1 Tax=Sinanodonta woodiana TaxID=1069815 RepID=A0ABD3X1N1_SINWO